MAQPKRIPAWLKGASIAVVLAVLAWEAIRPIVAVHVPKTVEIPYLMLGFAAAYVLLIDFYFSMHRRFDDFQSQVEVNLKQHREEIERRLSDIQKRFDSTSAALLALSQFDNRIVNVVQKRTGNRPVGPYLDWLLQRLRSLVQHIESGVLLASDPDYFGFANTVFEATQEEVVSTSKVDPDWYESDTCIAYINHQKSCLIDKGRKYTRIFFFHPQDPDVKRRKIRKVVKEHSALGFKNVVVQTNDYDAEFDCAMIDGGALTMEASVAVMSKQPVGEISGCVCYVSDICDEPSAKARAEQIKGYIHKLLNVRNPVIFGPGALTAEQLNELNGVLSL